jgi:sugar phosphate isomerase/epimerase
MMLKRLALCNEVLAPWGFAQQCAYASQLGYCALEVAPYTLADDPLILTDTQARQFSAIAADHGLAICGLHWLLVAPKGLSISSADAAVTARTRETIARLIDLCALMGGEYPVHGSRNAIRRPGKARPTRSGAPPRPGSSRVNAQGAWACTIASSRSRATRRRWSTPWPRRWPSSRAPHCLA